MVSLTQRDKRDRILWEVKRRSIWLIGSSGAGQRSSRLNQSNPEATSGKTRPPRGDQCDGPKLPRGDHWHQTQPGALSEPPLAQEPPEGKRQSH